MSYLYNPLRIILERKKELDQSIVGEPGQCCISGIIHSEREKINLVEAEWKRPFDDLPRGLKR